MYTSCEICKHNDKTLDEQPCRKCNGGDAFEADEELDCDSDLN